jgi:hypothetical protein
VHIIPNDSVFKHSEIELLTRQGWNSDQTKERLVGVRKIFFLIMVLISLTGLFADIATYYTTNTEIETIKP